MNRSIPFIALGLVAVTGWLTSAPSAATSDPTPTPPGTQASNADGSVRVTAQLERTHLVAGQSGEAYARVVLEGIEAPRNAERLPVSLTLVIDHSGSMSGQKMGQAREAAVSALDNLERGDRVSVVAFSSGSRVLVNQLTIGDGDIADAKRRIRQLRPTGGTNMHAALGDADRVSQRLFDGNRVNRVMLLSDGQPDNERGLADIVGSMASKGVHTTTLGVGRDYNEDLMSRLADAGLGNYYFVERASALASIFEQELRSLAAVVAKEAVVTIATHDGVRVLEVIGWDASRGERTTAVPVGDIFSGRKSDILLKVAIPAHAVGQAALIDVKVSYHDVIASAARRVALPLAAEFTTDRMLADASVVTEVAQKREEVLTARAIENAADAYSRGDKQQARRIFAEQKARVLSFADKAGKNAAPAAAEMSGALDEFEFDADHKDMAVATKKAKEKARRYKR